MFRSSIRSIATLSFSAIAVAQAFAAQGPKVSAQPEARVVQKIDSTKLVTLSHTVPAIVSSAKDLGRVPAGTSASHMLLVLKSSDQQEYALRSLIDEQQDKSSPNYHKWMTPETFGATFGAASNDLSAVKAWLQDSGFNVDSVAASGRVIAFSGNVGQVETAFHTEIHTITVGNETHVSNTTDISVPQALSTVVAGISRLNDFGVKAHAVNPHPLVKGTDGQFHPLIPGTDQPDYTSTSSGTHYVGPADVATIYNAKPLLTSGIDGTGVTIAVIGQTSINMANVEAFRSMFKLPNNDPSIINVGPPAAVISDDIESDLDVEWAGALATAAKIKFYTSSVSLLDGGVDTAALAAVDTNGADIISLSYGGCEVNNGASGTAFWNNLWEQAAAQGQSVFVSTGDSNATGCASSSATLATGSAASYGVNALGSSAYNVAVGGSEFNEGTTTGVTSYWGAGGTAPYGTALSYIPETVWNEGRFAIVQTGSGVEGGGGGVSIFTGRPAWQTGPGITAADPAGPTFTASGAIPASQPHRLVPDLSLIAAGGHDGTIFCSEGVCKLDSNGNAAGIGVVGGTSVATPVMAGIQALINQKNGGRQGNANYYYYKLAAAQTTANCASTLPPAASCNFNDIVTGNNFSPLTSNGYYDIPSATLHGTKGTDYLGFTAGTGFDVATGLGTPNISNLANNWSSVTFNATKTTLTLTPTTTTHGTKQTATISVAASSGSGTPTGDVSITAVGQATGAGDLNVYHLTAGSVTASLQNLPGGTYNVVAHYAGDLTYGASDSAPVSVTISSEASSMTMTPYNITTAGAVNSATTFAYGTSIYVDTEVAGVSSGTSVNSNNVPATGAPTGTVAFKITSGTTILDPYTSTLDPLGTTYLEFGQSFANFLVYANYPAVAPGLYAVSATYSGDSSFKTTTSATAFTVVKATVSPVVRVATLQITSGGTAIFNVSVATSGGGVAPTGTVTVTDTTTNTVLGTVTLANGTGVVTSTSVTTNGDHSITATYNGDTNYNTSTSSAATITVGGTSSTTMLTVSVGGAAVTTAPVLTSVTLTATPPSSATGAVYFYADGVNLGSANISTVTNIAALSLSSLTAGGHNLVAVYTGNSALASSTSNAVVFVSTQNKPTLSLTSQQANNSSSKISMNAVLALSPVNSATTNPPPPVPSAPIQFYDGTTLLGTSNLSYGLNYHNYSAAFTAGPFGPGTHVLTAKFAGDANYAAASSGVQNVAIGLTTTTLSSSITTGAGVNVPFTLTAQVTPQVASSMTLTGTVKFMDGTTVLGTAPVTNGTATLSATVTTTGAHSITATYSGDTNFASSTSNGVTVTAGAPGFTLVANPTTLTITRGAIGTATLTATPSGSYTGYITFTCSGLPANSTCIFSPSTITLPGDNKVAQTTLTIGTVAKSNAIRTTAVAGLLWIPALLFGTVLVGFRKQLSVRGRQLMLLVLLICGTMAVSGCGSSGFAGTPTGSSTVIVTANATSAGAGSPSTQTSVSIAVTIQ